MFNFNYFKIAFHEKVKKNTKSKIINRKVTNLNDLPQALYLIETSTKLMWFDCKL